MSTDDKQELPTLVELAEQRIADAPQGAKTINIKIAINTARMMVEAERQRIPSTAAVDSGETPRTDECRLAIPDLLALARQLERELAGLGRDYERLLKESTDELKGASSSMARGVV